MKRPATRAEAMDCQLIALEQLGLSLDIRCACTLSLVMPLKLMLLERPRLAGRPLGRLLIRLRCSHGCGQPPTRVALMHHLEHAYASAGQTVAWLLVVLGE